MTHACTKHAPGSPACYKSQRCRCMPCCAAESLRAKRARHATANGTPRLIPADLAAKRLTSLAESGMAQTEIEHRTGVDRSTMLRILRGEVERIRPSTMRRILSCRPAPISAQSGGRVDTTGTRRRLWALMAIGWSQRELARRLNTTPAQVERLRRHPTCNADTRARVSALYDELWDHPPTGDVRSASRSRNLAARHGWPVPMAWDDDSIDNPAATPANCKAGAIDTLAELEHLADSDATLPELMAQLDVGRDAIYNCCRRAGRLDLWRRITRTEAA